MRVCMLRSGIEEEHTEKDNLCQNIHCLRIEFRGKKSEKQKKNEGIEKRDFWANQSYIHFNKENNSSDYLEVEDMCIEVENIPQVEEAETTGSVLPDHIISFIEQCNAMLDEHLALFYEVPTMSNWCMKKPLSDKELQEIVDNWNDSEDDCDVSDIENLNDDVDLENIDISKIPVVFEDELSGADLENTAENDGEQIENIVDIRNELDENVNETENEYKREDLD
ncbi:unnamed protein product [Diabrotica balteata]|uniref:Uncharacterized protein n=1 Tax=Diabrotica balteata TaxID=107213 RepID=A0A9N9T847_DIABA|nr:unnamed protein product [Diabrotica balteata]